MTTEASAANTPGADRRFTMWVAGEVRAHLARRRLSQRALGRAVQRNATWVNERLMANVAMSTDDLALIAHALDMTPMELLSGQSLPPSTPPSGTAQDGRVTGRYSIGERLRLVRSPQVSIAVLPTPAIAS